MSALTFPLSPSCLAFIEGVGGPELLMIFFVVLLLFGGQKLPELARGLGKAAREFKKASASVEEEVKKALEEPVSAVRSAVDQNPRPKPAVPAAPATSPFPVISDEPESQPPTSPSAP